MKRLLFSLFVLAAIADARAQAPAAPKEKETSVPFATPARNWVLPIFTDKEGYRSMTLRGSEVRPGANTIAVKDFSVTVFSGNAAATVDSVLLSSSAIFFPKDQRATGDGTVRLIRDDSVLTGEGWAYDHAGQKVSIQRKVRVEFQAQLNDVLK